MAQNPWEWHYFCPWLPIIYLFPYFSQTKIFPEIAPKSKTEKKASCEPGSSNNDVTAALPRSARATHIDLEVQPKRFQLSQSDCKTLVLF